MAALSSPRFPIVGYEILREMRPIEFPSGFTKDPRRVGPVYFTQGYVVPPGVNPLELGLLSSPGLFQLLPVDAMGSLYWNDAIDLPVTKEEATRQTKILLRSYHALLDALPYDAVEIDEAVEAALHAHEEHYILALVRKATIGLWADQPKELKGSASERISARVAQRTLMLLWQLAPPCSLDQESLQAVMMMPASHLCVRIQSSIAEADYTDAILRTLARIKRGRLELPAALVIELLPEVPQLDIFFLLVRNATSEIVSLLTHHLSGQIGLTRRNPTALAIRILYAIWSLDSSEPSRSLVQWALRLLAREPVESIERSMRIWLAYQLGDQSLVRLLAEDEPDLLDDNAPTSPAYLEAIAEAERAFRATIDDVIATLPVCLSR